VEPVRLGIIGCGIAARELHWPALRGMKDVFAVTAVCNHTEPKAKSFAELVGGVPYVLDYHELLTRDDVDAVSIILPFKLNYHVTGDALEAGKHVMVEKPLAADLTDAAKMVKFKDQYPSLVMMVAENFRYRQLYRWVKALLDEQIIGVSYAVNWNFFTDVSAGANKRYMSTKWRFEPAYPGGFPVDGGVHIIAALRDLFGEFIRGSAQTRCVNPDAGRFDTMHCTFTMANGIIGEINLFYSSRGFRVNTLHIFGDEGTILVDNYSNTIMVKRPGMPDSVETPEEEHGYAGEYKDFYNAIKTGSPVASSFDEAYHDLKVITRAVESAETGEIVMFE